MTLFIQLQDGQPVGFPIAEGNFRQLFPRTSFPAHFTAEVVEPYGYGIYDFATPPETGRYEKAVEVAPVRNEFGIWRQTYAVAAMDDAEKREVDARQAESVRADRNARLAACDWTQLADAPVDSLAWGVYRQGLRDITAQDGFPWSVEWPTTPA